MVDRFVRIGAIEDGFGYDDVDFPGSAIETDQPIKAGPPVAGDDVLRIDDLGVIAGDVVGPAASTDEAITRFDGITGKLLQNSLLFLDDTGNLYKAGDLELDCGANNTLELIQQVYDDLRFPVGSVKGAGAFPPADQPYRGGIVLDFTTGPNSESIQFLAQLPHTYKQGEDVVFHVHWTIPTDGLGLGAENVKWDFTYSWANINAVFPGEATEPLTVDVQNRVAHTHYMDNVFTLNGAGKNISSIIICSLTRDVTVANDYGHSAYFLEADFHYPVDTIGSRQIGTK